MGGGCWGFGVTAGRSYWLREDDFQLARYWVRSSLLRAMGMERD